MALRRDPDDMGKDFIYRTSFLLVLFTQCATALALGAAASPRLTIRANWDKVVAVSKTNATLVVAPSPLLRRGPPLHDRAFQVLRDLKGDVIRYIPWYPYPIQRSAHARRIRRRRGNALQVTPARWASPRPRRRPVRDQWVYPMMNRLNSDFR